MDYESFQKQSSVGGRILNALRLLLVVVVLPGLLIWGGYAAWKALANQPEVEVASHSGVDDIEALVLCQQTIKRISVNPNTAEVPFARSIDNGETWRFLWNNDSGLQLQNQFGAMIGVFAACSVDKATGKILQLQVDGQTII